MKVLFISDIHGDYGNLRNLNLDRFASIVILGDIYSNYACDDNEQIKKWILENRYKIICVRGNCDSDFDYISLNLPVQDVIKLKLDELTIYATHGNLYNLNKQSYFENCNVLIYGHEHISYINQLNGVTYICVGSISKPRYGAEASYCVYEDRTFTLLNKDGQVIDFIKI